MYTHKQWTYSDAGYYLVSNLGVGFQFCGEVKDERELDYHDMHLESGYLYYSDGLFIQKYRKDWTYADYKRDFIKKRYSNDDQIALMLNKDDSDHDAYLYNKMLEWREFSSDIASHIVGLLNIV